MYTYAHPHPAVTADVVVLRQGRDRREVLLVQRRDEPYAGRWALPGGFIDIDEDLEDGARRELREETGLKPSRLEQLHCFGAPERDPRERVITVAFLAVLKTGGVDTRSGSDAADVAWFDCACLPDLAFDHRDIISMALERAATMG
ncbi:MAG: NUDIX hydrolase [Gammaproteobacteria bacterium]|nr:NUDIX hydrolase [Gammaproteobacteria bacterium]NND37255.1 NUDIX hydrolase [Gammaproteobacteria bacterium]